MPRVSTFLRKLMEMLEDPAHREIIGWTSDGTGFQIIRVAQFTETTLPLYFKHNNMASFVRQLNMYGFARSKDSDQHAYQHPNFKREKINSLRYIKRKKKSRISRLCADDSDRGGESLSFEANHSSEVHRLMLQCSLLEKSNQELREQNKRLSLQLEQIERRRAGESTKMEEKFNFVPRNKMEQSGHSNLEQNDGGSFDRKTSQSSRRGVMNCVIQLQGRR